MADVVMHFGDDIGIEYGSGGPFEFTELGKDFMGERDRNSGVLQQFFYFFLMGRIGKGKNEADCY